MSVSEYGGQSSTTTGALFESVQILSFFSVHNAKQMEMISLLALRSCGALGPPT